MDRLRKFSDIVVYNVLFVICAIPVITAGAALLSLCEGMQKLSEDKAADFPVAKTFFATFRKNFGRATGLWILSVFGYVFLYFLLYAAASLSGGSQATMYMASFYVMALLLVFGYQNLFQAAAKWQELSVLACVIRSYLMAGAGFGWTLLGVILTSLIGGLTVSANPFFIPLGLLFWGVCGFGLTAYLCSFCFRRAAAKYEKKWEET